MSKHWPGFLIIFSVLLFSPSFFNFFSGDDWFHLSLVQINSLSEFVNFFKFSPSLQSASFYRPLPTQVFFFVFHSLFGLKQIYYHIFVLAFFAFSLYLVYKLALLILKSKQQSIMVLLLYGFSVTHFTRLYFLSAFQEIALTVFMITALYRYIQGRTLNAAICFIFALLCKETAIILPALLLLSDYCFNKINLKRYVPFLAISLVYLYCRFFIFQSISGDSYIWNFSLFKALNTLFWYILWSFGTPEFLVDYIGSGLKVIPKFFTDFKYLSFSIIALPALTIITSILVMFKIRPWMQSKKMKILLFSGLWFLITLLPVLFLPLHKFQLELTLPLIGFAIFLSQFIDYKNYLSKFFVILFLGLNLFSYFLTYPRHYSIGRAKISENIYQYIGQNYPDPPPYSYFEFINDTGNYGNNWGSSKQISFAISGPDMFRVFYQNKNIEVFYEDFVNSLRPQNKTKIQLSSSQFIH